MIHYLDWTASSPLAIALSEALCYALAVFAGGLVLWRICRDLVASGHAVAPVARFASVLLVVAAPAAWLGWRAGSLLRLPPDSWRWELLLRAPRLDASHSFDAAILAPLLLLWGFTRVRGLPGLRVMDTAFLALPLAHAMSRVGCLWVACCWGETVRLGLPGLGAAFPNPAPLYSIGLDLLIFALLREIFRSTDRSAETRRRWQGMVSGGYLLLHGASGLVMESFSHPELVLGRLGLAELWMLVLVASGSAALWRIRARSRRALPEIEVCEDARRAMARLTSILGVAASHLLLIFLFYYLTRRTHLLPTPFQGVDSVGEAYARILFSVPLAIPALAALFFFLRAGERVRPFLRRPRTSPVFGAALLVSALYALYMLLLRGSLPTGWAFLAYVPPVVILSAVNAVSEELIHRMAVLRLLLVSGFAGWGAILVQGVLYSLVHFMIAPSLGVMAFGYGLLLGVLMSRTRSLTACILCHFVIDLGVIGGPMLAG